MSLEQNKALAHQLIEEIFNQGNVSRVDQLIASDFVEHEELPPGIPSGRDGYKQAPPMLRNAFLDLKVTTNDIVAEGDKVTLRLTWSGTQKGDFMGIPPTGKHMSIAGFEIYRIADGKIVEHWGLIDRMAMMHQLGVMPMPGQGES